MMVMEKKKHFEDCEDGQRGLILDLMDFGGKAEA